MILLLASAALAGAIAALVIAAGASLAAPLASGRDHVRLAFGIGGLGLASLLVFIGYWMHPILGAVLSVLVIVGSAVRLIARRAWRSLAAALPILLGTGGVVVVYVAAVCLWSPAEAGFAIVTTHFSDLGLPSDSIIPFLFSDRLASGLPTHLLIDDWNGSDRPPLQSGFLLLERVLVAPLGAEATAAAGAGIVAQALWVPALFAALRSAGLTRAAGWVTVAFVALSGTVFVNTVYTWPKLLSAALVLCACVMLVDAIRRPRAFPVAFPAAVVLFVLGMLAHGAAAFAAPLLVLLGLIAYRRQPRRAVVWTTAIALGAGALAYLPWLLYQRLADPPGDRLVKWHLAGAVALDDRSAGQALADAYSSLTPLTWLQGRLGNLLTIVHPNLLEGAPSPLLRRSAEFFTTTTSLGLSLVFMLAILLALVVRRRPLGLADRLLLFVLAASTASIALWALLMFTPGSTIAHQGSHVWVLLLLAAPIAWLLRRHRRLTLAALGAQALLFGLVYLPQPQPGPLSLAAVAVGLAGACCVASAIWLSRVRRMPRRR